MDGTPSAPDSDPESLERTERPSRAADDRRELNALRARAYGPQADISADPAAGAEPEEGDGFGRWLPEGSIVRFHFRGDTVDVFVRPPGD
ncbi:hypothetical protein [Microbacterium sp. LWH3-1.2]|uniref:hypothetical protein n=1 Tax=Microbacterium sp. LWH3-1.2 TaxID=3135256 RepID=UPI003413F9D5